MSRFTTLLHREWMQHRRGWLILVTVPPVVALVAMLFGHVEGEPDVGPGPLMLVAGAGITGLVVAISWIVAVFTAPGLATRDQQDRSIEFWTSLPTSHTENVGATVLMQGLLFPLMALVCAFVLAQPPAFALAWRLLGSQAMTEMPWGTVLSVDLAGIARATFGLVLATLWASPVYLLLMASAAWFKRWGTAVVIIVLALGNGILSKAYGITWIGDAFKTMATHIQWSFAHPSPEMEGLGSPAAVDRLLDDLPRWMLNDAWLAVRDLASIDFVVTMAISAALFALLVWRRQRG